MKVSRIILVFLATMFSCSIIGAQPLFIRNIGLVKQGIGRMDESEVIKYLGNPTEISFSRNNGQDTETIHYQKYDTGNELAGLATEGAINGVLPQIGGALLRSGGGGLFSYVLPFIADGTQKATAKARGETIFYSADITLTDGVVTNVSYRAPAGNVSKKSGGYKAQFQKVAKRVYASPEEREFHLLNCVGLGNLNKDELVEFNSADDAINSGGIPDPACIH